MFKIDDPTNVEKFDGSSFQFKTYDECCGMAYPDQVSTAARG